MKVDIDITDKVYVDGCSAWDWHGYGIEFSCWKGTEECHRTAFTQPISELTLSSHVFFFMLRRDIHDIIASYDPTYTIHHCKPMGLVKSEVILRVEETIAAAVRLSI